MPSRSRTSSLAQWSAHRARRAGEPAGADRSRCDRRARFPFPRVLRAPRLSGCSAQRSPGRAPARRLLHRLGDTDFEKIYLYPNSHAGYYPGAKPIAMKVLFRKSDGRLLGAQAVGEDGGRQADQRRRPGDPARARRCTTSKRPSSATRPPFGSAKDPINFAGMVAADVLRGDMPLSSLGRCNRTDISSMCARSARARRGRPAGIGQHPAR